MSARESYFGKSHEPAGLEDNRRLADASKLILLDEYESLLRTIEPIRVLNRSMLIDIVLFQIVYAPIAILYQVPLLVAAALASCFWFLQEFSTSRRLSRLGELIASTSGKLMAGTNADYSRPVTLPPLPRESQA